MNRMINQFWRVVPMNKNIKMILSERLILIPYTLSSVYVFQ